jgi:hypothetical protein
MEALGSAATAACAGMPTPQMQWREHAKHGNDSDLSRQALPLGLPPRPPVSTPSPSAYREHGALHAPGGMAMDDDD